MIRQLPLALVLLLAGGHPARAHDIDLELRSEGSVLVGELRYSDQSAAQGNYVQIENLSDPRFTPLALQTGPGGRFQLAATPGHRYEVTVDGDEGHRISARIDMPAWRPPVYLIIGALLLLSLPLAWWLQRRDPGQAG